MRSYRAQSLFKSTLLAIRKQSVLVRMQWVGPRQNSMTSSARE